MGNEAEREHPFTPETTAAYVQACKQKGLLRHISHPCRLHQGPHEARRTPKPLHFTSRYANIGVFDLREYFPESSMAMFRNTHGYSPRPRSTCCWDSGVDV
ncbi:conidiophore development protein HymA [Aspergillus luchuensis]|uniref:Conidiophore development protein HymA n=1 Tax=Aspergillus kawachii TaxID=1069201 RepID=A0A146F1R2_ASPKA|nr:conidiophore development protein HymA [Aspergillus luchuensis]